MARQRSAKPATRRRSRASAAPAQTATILAWEDDPGAPGAANTPVERATPKLDQPPLRIRISGRAPAARQYAPGTSGFRYWAAADALQRGSQLWSGLVPSGTKWYSTVGRSLTARLDEGEDLNAYYDRRGLNFFHAAALGTIVYSGESPDVVCHELGHAILDALCPDLFDSASVESAAFHESFADMSAILCALQLQSVREEVLAETSRRPSRASRLSRLAEQLGAAIRQFAPDAVDRDCLRNAVNSLFYRDPATLPPSAPATTLSSEPHSFSRVFTAAFFQLLAGIFALQQTHDQAALLQASTDAGQLLVEAVRQSPVVPSYYSQVAAHFVEADDRLFSGLYRDVVKSAFVRQGILSLDSVAAIGGTAAAPGARGTAAAAAPSTPPRLRLAGSGYGLSADLLVAAPSDPKRFAVAGAAPSVGSVDPPSHDRAAALFVEDLFRRGRVDVGPHGVADAVVSSPLARKTHELRAEAGGVYLARRFFDCGFDCGYNP
jgi:hypothetical protein